MSTIELLTAVDVAKVLKISKALAYRLIAKGEIQSVRFGRTVRVRQKALNDFIQRCVFPKETSTENRFCSTANRDEIKP